MHLFSAKAGQAQCCPSARYFAYSALIIGFKGVPIKLKIVALEISLE